MKYEIGNTSTVAIIFILDYLHDILLTVFLKDLQKAILDHVADVEYVNKTGEDLVKRSSVASSSSDQAAKPSDQTSVLQLQLASLNARWRAISDNIQEKLGQLAEGIEQLKIFEVCSYYVSV